MPGEADLQERVRQARRRLATLGPTTSRSPGDFDRTALPQGECDQLRDLLVGEGARVVIEIGLAYGSSALAIGEALASVQDAQHVIIDAFQDRFENVGWNSVVGAGLEAISTLVPERSQIVLPRLVAEGLVADAAFVDGSHVFHNVFVDLYFLREIVRPGGLVILDDCHWPSVATAARYYEVNAGWTPAIPEPAGRLRSFRLPDPRSEPGFEDFEPFGV